MTKHCTTLDSRRKSLISKQDDKDAAAVSQFEADQAQTINVKAVGSTRESSACSVGLSHAGCEVQPRADERIAMDTALRDPESRRSLCVTKTLQSCRMRRRRRSLSLTLPKRHLALRERGVMLHGRRTPRYLRSSTACSRRPRRTSTDANMCRPSCRRRWTKASRSTGTPRRITTASWQLSCSRWKKSRKEWVTTLLTL